MFYRHSFFYIIIVSIFGCSGGGGGSQETNSASQSPAPVVDSNNNTQPNQTPTSTPSPSSTPLPSLTSTPAVPSPIRQEENTVYNTKFTQTVDADGPGQGLDAYTIVRNAFGSRSIEAPDQYSGDHQSVLHLLEDEDPVIGPHFVFLLHRDEDGDKGRFIDRQRNEIKVYNSSRDELKGFEGKTFEYRWKFKVNEDMSLTSRFSHFFQLKAVYGDDAQPIVTISASDNSRGKTMQIRYSPHTLPRDTQYLAFADWDQVKGQWLEVFCRATFAEADAGGMLQLQVTRMSDNAKVLSVNEAVIDMWRGPANADEIQQGRVAFVRPKWGYYRSVLERDKLRPEEERVHFANFDIREVELSQD